MPDFMTKMPEQRAVWLTHPVTATFTLHIIGFRQIDGDDAALMSGHHRGRRVGKKIER